jgi:hypothetical protein
MTRFSILDFRFSQGQVSNEGDRKPSWVSRLIDFVLGPASTPHPIYIVGAAAFSHHSAETQPRLTSARPYRGDEADTAQFALAASGLGSYGAASTPQEYTGGRR